MENKYYITRREDLRDHADKTEISLQEWMGFVKMDPDMRLENETTVKLPDGSDYTYPSPGKAVWLYREAGQASPREVLFDYESGNVVISNPDTATLKKIQHIAFKLNTRVFKETPHDTGHIIAEEPVLVPRFSFSTMMTPFRKVITHMAHSLQQSIFSLFNNSPEKVVRNPDDKTKDQ